VASLSEPFGRLTFVAASTWRTSSSAIPYLLSAEGLSSTRTDGNELPPTMTCPTPRTCASFCCRMLDAMSYICPRLFVGDVRAMMMIGASAGFTLR